MNDDRNEPLNRHCKILHLSDHKRGENGKPVSKPGPKVQIEVICNEPLGQRIESFLATGLRRIGCAVVKNEDPEWIYSVIGFQHGEFIELSVVLRQFFKSTLPGTEIDSIESDGKMRLRSGAWVYESLRFHGLYGVIESELESFLTDIAAEFGRQFCDRISGKRLR